MSDKLQTQPKNRPAGMPGGPRMGGGPAEKAKDFKGTLKKLVHRLRRYWWQIGAVLLFAIGSTIFTIVSPKILGNATNQIVDDFVVMKAYDTITEKLPSGTKLPAGTTGADVIKQMPESAKTKLTDSQLSAISDMDLSQKPEFHFDAILQIVIWLLGLYLLSLIFGYVQGWIMTGVTQKVTYELRKEISQKINRLPLKYFDKQSHGEVLSRVTNDVDTISQSLNQSLSQMVTALVTVIGILIMMLTISPLLTLVAVVTLPISVGLIGFVTKRSQKQFVRQQDLLGNINGHIEEMYAGHQVVRVFNGEKASVDKFSKINDKLYDSAWKAQFFSGLMFPLMSFVGNLGYVGVAVIGGWRAVNGHLQVGDIQAFIQYVNQFNQPIAQTANIMNVLQSTVASSERVFEFLEEPEQSLDPAKPQKNKVYHRRSRLRQCSLWLRPQKTCHQRPVGVH